MKIATWNVNSIRVRMPQLLKWLGTAAPDVVCLQETKVVDNDFPHLDLHAAGYVHRVVYGQKTYNGVAILSRLPLEAVQYGFTDGEPDPQTRLLAATVGGIRVVNGYIPNGSPLGSDKYTYKLAWLARLRAELNAHADPATDVLVCGDFNVAPDDIDLHDPFEADDILSTAPERAAYQSVVDFGLVDAYRHKQPFGAEFSWWDYRQSAFRFNRGYRIDHILITRSLLPRVAAIGVDREPRTWDQPSDHAPVVLTLR